MRTVNAVTLNPLKLTVTLRYTSVQRTPFCRSWWKEKDLQECRPSPMSCPHNHLTTTATTNRTIAKHCSGRKWYIKRSPTVRDIQLKSVQHSVVYGPTQRQHHTNYIAIKEYYYIQQHLKLVKNKKRWHINNQGNSFKLRYCNS